MASGGNFDPQTNEGLYWDVEYSAVHIPECDPSCNLPLFQVGNALRDKGFCCVFKYQPNGLFLTSFEKSFADFTFTILHKCPILWEKVHKSKCLQGSSKLLEKIVVVTLNNQQNTDNTYRTMDGFDQFYSKFKLQDISDETKLNAFVEVMVDELKKYKKAVIRASTPVTEEACAYTNTPEHITSTFGTLEEVKKLQSVPRKQKGLTFVPCPDIFGGAEHQDSEIWINSLESQTRENARFFAICEGKEKTADGLTQTIDSYLNKEQICKKDVPAYLKKARFIFEKILPEFYTKRDLLGLACTAVCKEPEIQKRALTLLELSILNSSASDHEISLETLFEISRRLTSSMRTLRKENQPSRLLVRNQTFNVLLMVLTETAMACSKSEKLSEWDSLAKELKPMLVERELSLSTFKNDEQVKTFLKFLSKPIKGTLQTVMEFIKSKNPSVECLSKMCKQRTQIQFAVIQEFLKEIFLRMDQKKVDFLRSYVEIELHKNWGSKMSHKKCIALILLGISHFLAHVSREAADCDITEICTMGIQLVSVASKIDLPQPDGTCYMLKQLLFNKVPVVRMQANEILFKKFRETVEVLLFNGVHDRLCPLLEIEENIEVPTTNQGEWLHVFGRFNGQNVKVVLHKTVIEDHWHMNETRFSDRQGKRHSNLVKKLKSLEHPNIMKMFAYQMDRIPQFYVVENGSSLQMIMKNLNQNNGRSNLSDLLKYLIDCAGALEFCHNKQILYCNLTAGSLILVGDKKKTAKLGCFEMAVELKPGEHEKSIEHNIQNIPTRWSPAETLRKGVVSKLSDSWMFGILICEVLSHGALPYSNLKISEAELVWRLFPQVFHAPPMLSREECMQPKHFELITKCVDLDPKKRPAISEIKSQLENFLEESLGQQTRISCRQGSREHRPSSTEIHRGIPDGISPFWNIHKLSMVHVERKGKLSIFQTEFGYVLRQKTDRMISKNFHGNIASALPWLFFPDYSACEDESVYEFDSYLFDCHLPVTQINDLQSVVQNRSFGHNLQSYMASLLQVAEQLQELHQRSLILGKFSASDFFLDPTSAESKVYAACVGNLQLYNQEPKAESSSTYRNLLRGNRQVVRSPNNLSTATDIWYLGNMVKKVFQELGITVCDFKRKSKQRRLKPTNCCRPLYDQMMLCLDADETKRPTMAKMISEIKALTCAELKRIKLMRESTTDSDCSQARATVKHSKHIREMNPSDRSQTSGEDISLSAGAVATNRNLQCIRAMNPSDSSDSTQTSSDEQYLNVAAASSDRPRQNIREINPSDPSDSSMTSTDEVSSNVPYRQKVGIPRTQVKGVKNPQISKHASETTGQDVQKMSCSCTLFGPRIQSDQIKYEEIYNEPKPDNNSDTVPGHDNHIYVNMAAIAELNSRNVVHYDSVEETSLSEGYASVEDVIYEDI